MSQCAFAYHIHGRIRSVQTIDTVHSHGSVLFDHFWTSISRSIQMKVKLLECFLS